MFSKCIFCNKRKNLSTITEYFYDFSFDYHFHEECLLDVIKNPDKYEIRDLNNATKIHKHRAKRKAYERKVRAEFEEIRDVYGK